MKSSQVHVIIFYSLEQANNNQYFQLLDRSIPMFFHENAFNRHLDPLTDIDKFFLSNLNFASTNRVLIVMDGSWLLCSRTRCTHVL